MNCCFTKESVAVIEPTIRSKKTTPCMSCNSGRSIITLECTHAYCVKCYYANARWNCTECEKNKIQILHGAQNSKANEPDSK